MAPLFGFLITVALPTVRAIRGSRVASAQGGLHGGILNTDRYFATSEDVIAILRRFIPNFSKHQSFLSKESWVSDLLSDDRLNKALINANSIGTGGESYSKLPKLFEIVE